MAQTKIKAGLFEGIIGNGTDGYFLMSNGDGTMTWSSIIVNPTINNLSYPGSVTAADPDGDEIITVTGTGFKTGATVTVGGTAAPAVSYVSSTTLTITTPAKAAGDYDVVVTNTDTGSATFINGISYNGIPSWTTATGSLGTFASNTTISTITLQATEPDAGTITFNITNGALPTGLSLTGADIDGTTSLETADTLYTFTVTATDDESQATPRTFTITVKKEFKSVENFTINTYTGNGSTQSIEGKIGTAASFNGSSSKIVVPKIPGLSSASISCWVKTTNTASVSRGIVELNNDTGSNGFAGTLSIIYNTGSGTFTIRNGNGSSSEVNLISHVDTTIRNGNWHHIAVARNESTGVTTLYIDGTQAAQQTVSSTSTAGPGTLIGDRHYTASNYHWDGEIDQVRIFNKALSSSEVTTLYGESNTSTTKSTTDIFDDGSGVALYEFEEGAKDTGVLIDDGQSASFIGTNQNYIQLPSGIDTILNTKNFGLSFWVKAPNATTDAAFSTETTNSTFQIHANWTHAGSYSLTNGGGSNINLGAVDDLWHHIVVTSDGSSSYKGYFDKSYKGASAYRQTSNVGTFLGAHPAGGFNLLGEIDQVRIFNRQLSQSDIDALYNETAPTTVDYFGDGNGKALYTLNGTPDDESGSYDATWNGTAAYSDPAEITYNGTPANVSFVGTSFQPDLIWVKSRSGAFNNMLTDSINGDNTHLIANTTAALDTNSSAPQFNTNGFTLGAGNNNWNGSGYNYVAWCWKAGGAASLNENGSIDSQVSANPDAGFSIVKYVGSSTIGLDIGHGLSSAPEMVILKNLDSSHNWYIYHKDTGTTSGYINYLRFDSTAGTYSDKVFYPVDFNNSTFIAGHDTVLQGNMIAYCFHSVDGYQKVGSYSGSGSAGNKQTTGFQPRFVMLKAYSGGTSGWFIFDSERSGEKRLAANTSSAESDETNHGINFESDGFSFDAADANNSGVNWIYLAIA